MDEIRNQIQGFQELQKANILRGFDIEVNNEIEKARSGVYKDNALNRKLLRVGQEYGKKLNVNLSTEQQYKKGNRWTYYRIEKVHKPIIEKYLNKVKPSDEPTCTLIMGAPATGKGYLRNYLQEKKIYMILVM